MACLVSQIPLKLPVLLRFLAPLPQLIRMDSIDAQHFSFLFGSCLVATATTKAASVAVVFFVFRAVAMPTTNACKSTEVVI